MTPKELVLTARKNAKMTQSMLAAQSGVCEATISLVENGRVWPKTLILYSLLNACGFDLSLVALNRERK